MAARIGAASLLLIFLSGWLATPVRLAMPDAPSCAMECCLAQGYCSCGMSKTTSAHPADHEHSEGEAGAAETQAVEMDAATITAPCPQSCAQVPSGLRNFAAHKTAAPEYSVTLSSRQLLHARAPRFARDALLAEAHSPRGPPFSLL